AAPVARRGGRRGSTTGSRGRGQGLPGGVAGARAFGAAAALLAPAGLADRIREGRLPRRRLDLTHAQCERWVGVCDPIQWAPRRHLVGRRCRDRYTRVRSPRGAATGRVTRPWQALARRVRPATLGSRITDVKGASPDLREVMMWQ